MVLTHPHFFRSRGMGMMGMDAMDAMGSGNNSVMHPLLPEQRGPETVPKRLPCSAASPVRESASWGDEHPCLCRFDSHGIMINVPRDKRVEPVNNKENYESSILVVVCPCSLVVSHLQSLVTHVENCRDISSKFISKPHG